MPQRGEKRDLVNHAHNNAREALGRQLAESAAQGQLLEGVADLFGLDEAAAAYRGLRQFATSRATNAVGGDDRRRAGGLLEEARTARSTSARPSITPGDDFGMMREVLTRRFARLAKRTAHARCRATSDEDSRTGRTWCSSMAARASSRGARGDRSKIASLAARGDRSSASPRAERDAGPRKSSSWRARTPSCCRTRDPVLYFVQRLRDEAHRFAIGSHRARRKKDIVKNPLDEIEGIGPTRKRALLQHFGSAKAVSRASLADLAAIPGISNAMAQLVYDHFNRT